MSNEIGRSCPAQDTPEPLAHDVLGTDSVNKHLRTYLGIVAIGAALALVAPLQARQAPANDGPTKKDPIRFSAFNVSMPTGTAGMTHITIERWTADDERASLLDVLAGAKWGEDGQAKLLKALQAIKPRVGFIRTSKSLGWDLKYARENALPDGTRQIVIATDKPVSMGAAMRGGRAMDYPFTFIEMRMKPNAKGEGRMLAASSIIVKDGKIQLENYGQEPVRLTSITEEVKKPKS
jgi:hypothetical protein